ncbi:SRPBCC family protein [Promicromonospora iranensis]|uniref:Polyketide cyclase/dehydrase/lipid transport protein n=1 Tax=Promicromonospora iranensis TaxID=1105144 RepID=A0ABU2CSF5_9MICO|nr:SRPBCC family protein [Promicromonospora iranensis]MDR7384259.1 hypothetical protein [Promicromonospora iranensis]
MREPTNPPRDADHDPERQARRDTRSDEEWDADPEPPHTSRPPLAPEARRARLLLAGVALALFAAMLVAKLLDSADAQQTALFYVGIPAVIALTVILTARPRSAVGTALATTTVGLALAGPFLNEGVVCLVIAAPLFYGVAAAIGSTIQRSRNHRGRALAVAPLLLLLMAEGIGGFSLLPRDDTGVATVVVQATPEQVAAALAAPPTYGEFEAPFLRAVPFPEPVSATGSGLRVGDERHVTFSPRRSLGINTGTTPRAMSLRVAQSQVSATGGHLRLDVTSDTTLARWMDLHAADVTWEAAGAGRTRVTWALEYTRTFDPSWYFGPIQHYASGLASEYLIETFASTAEHATAEHAAERAGA